MSYLPPVLTKREKTFWSSLFKPQNSHYYSLKFPFSEFKLLCKLLITILIHSIELSYTFSSYFPVSSYDSCFYRNQ